MLDVMLRLGVLVIAGMLAWLLVGAGRLFVARSRQQALLAAPFPAPEQEIGKFRILAFSSADCRQCHTHQAPALRQVLATNVDRVAIAEIDAPTAPDLTARYHVLTVPSTVVLDPAGNVLAVNYGFAPAAKLLAQIATYAQSA